MRKYIKFLPKILTSVSILAVLISCHNDDDKNLSGDTAGISLPATPHDSILIKQLSAEMLKVQSYVPQNAVIAHRGTTYWAPESTESAFRWARNMGADYLEADLQISKDGVVLVMHDAHMKNKTNISELAKDSASIFFGKEDAATSEFTYEELMQLDAAYPFMNDKQVINESRNRQAFSTEHQYISTLEDLLQIAKGFKIKRDANGKRIWSKNSDGTYRFEYEKDAADNGNKPGVYLELKQPELNPGLETAMGKILAEKGWDITQNPVMQTEQFKDGKINVGNTKAKVVLQTFLLSSLQKLKNMYSGQIPTAYLASNTTMDKDTGNPVTYARFINDGVENLAQFFGPSIGGKPNNYKEMLNPWQAHMIRRSKMKIHPWTFDTEIQMVKHYEGTGFADTDKYAAPPYCDAMFTNRSDLTIQYYINKGVRKGGPVYQDPNTTLSSLGY